MWWIVKWVCHVRGQGCLSPRIVCVRCKGRTPPQVDGRLLAREAASALSAVCAAALLSYARTQNVRHKPSDRNPPTETPSETFTETPRQQLSDRRSHRNSPTETPGQQLPQKLPQKPPDRNPHRNVHRNFPTENPRQKLPSATPGRNSHTETPTETPRQKLPDTEKNSRTPR